MLEEIRRGRFGFLTIFTKTVLPFKWKIAVFYADHICFTNRY